jgi:purine-binding chemotaxis protein CheW
MNDTLILFDLDGFHFALDALKVERVEPAAEISPVPDLPRGVLGVVNVAGKAVPVFDLRGRLGLATRGVSSRDHFILARAGGRVVALMVDSVTDVLPADFGGIITAPSVLPGLESVGGWAKVNGDLIMIYDLEKFLSADERATMESALGN